MQPFDSIYRHGFVRVAVAVPPQQLADPAANARATIRLAEQAAAGGALIVVFPELGLSGYSNDDLFQQSALQQAALAALADVVAASRTINALLLVGVPLVHEAQLFNCAVYVSGGQLLGVVPKSYLPNYREFYEKRQFAAARDAVGTTIEVCGTTVPFGNDLIVRLPAVAGLAVHTEICEDVWTPLPPSTFAALAGATVLCNLSASNITVGKADYRRTLVGGHSARTLAAYLYSAAGAGESTTDLAWDGHALIAENGELLAESERFSSQAQLVTADIDLERLLQERARVSSFRDSVADHRDRLRNLRTITVPLAPTPVSGLQRRISRFPFVPSDAATRAQRCYEAYNIQVHGLEQRLRSSGIQRLVVGVSGGLDSTQALLVAVQAMDRMGLPRSNILGYSMPGFATSSRTRNNALALMQALGVTAQEIDIRPACRQMLRDLGHPAGDGAAQYDVTFENVQAGERTSHLFRLANHHGALVLGTGDLSELALGWCTYGVGDHMSHYNVNASVPKTLIKHLIRWVIESGQAGAAATAILAGIVATTISPELVPGAGDDEPAQQTEAIIGPYALQDFTLYYTTRYGYRPSKIAYLAQHAWSDAARGDWPADTPPHERVAYDMREIVRWLEVFLFRFFQTSQFKRSAVPNGPKVGSGGSLSPRGDWRAPSDATATVWLEELRRYGPFA
jgi:NAD+ synthase (glutamine-hydrolysing)